MSLFDVIKYSGIDLDNTQDLNNLPVDIFNKYFKRVRFVKKPTFNLYWSRQRKCGELALWARKSKITSNRIFKKVLEDL